VHTNLYPLLVSAQVLPCLCVVLLCSCLTSHPPNSPIRAPERPHTACKVTTLRAWRVAIVTPSTNVQPHVDPTTRFANERRRRCMSCGHFHHKMFFIFLPYPAYGANSRHGRVRFPEKEHDVFLHVHQSPAPANHGSSNFISQRWLAVACVQTAALETLELDTASVVG